MHSHTQAASSQSTHTRRMYTGVHPHAVISRLGTQYPHLCTYLPGRCQQRSASPTIGYRKFLRRVTTQALNILRVGATRHERCSTTLQNIVTPSARFARPSWTHTRYRRCMASHATSTGHILQPAIPVFIISQTLAMSAEKTGLFGGGVG